MLTVVSKVSAASLRRESHCSHVMMPALNPEWESCARSCGLVRRVPLTSKKNNLGKNTFWRETWIKEAAKL